MVVAGREWGNYIAVHHLVHELEAGGMLYWAVVFSISRMHSSKALSVSPVRLMADSYRVELHTDVGIVTRTGLSEAAVQ